MKNEHSNSIEKNRNKNMNIFYSIFNVVLVYQGLLFRPNIRKRIRRKPKKRGMALPAKNLTSISAFQFLNGQTSELSYG